MNPALVSLALFGASVVADWGYNATGVGSAHVVNKCSYPVKLCAVPSAGGGQQQSDTHLAPGGSWSQPWTSLTNGNGWSIKLSKSDNMDNILQYEYTFHDDGIIWYDLSCVNGNPWDKDWEITAAGTTCDPRQAAYRYSTDDAYGMQSCSQDSVITVTLCTGISADNGTAVDASSAPAGYAAPSSPSSPAAPAYTAPASPAGYQDKAAPTPAPAYNNDAAKAPAAYTPTTLSTAVASTYDDSADVVTVTHVETVYQTQAVTATAYARHRRHEHGHHA